MTPDPVGRALLEAVAVMDRLRSPGGCPWDAEQTHASLAPYAVEEAHEVAEAAEAGDLEALREELGDLLLQVLFHSRVAAERGADGFDIDDVARGLVAKLTARHPHVFAPDGARDLTPSDVNEQWDAIKASEKRRSSVLEGVPVSLPALARAQKVVRRARKAGIDVDGTDPDTGDDDRLGAELLRLVRAADATGVDAEAALRAQVRRVEARVRDAEGTAPAAGGGRDVP